MGNNVEGGGAAGRRPGRRRAVVVVVVILCVAVAGLGGWWAGHSGHHPPSPATTSTSAPAPAASAAATPGVQATVGYGLVRGTAAADGVAASAIDGVPVGWPRTLDGAISAALNDQDHAEDKAFYAESTAMTIAKRISATQDFADAIAGADFRAKVYKALGVNDQMQPLTATGQIDSTRHYIGGGQARYGAYNVSSVSADPATGLPFQVQLQVYVPGWWGTDPNSLTLDTRAITYVMQWGSGPDMGPADWRILHSPSGTKMTLSPAGVSNPGYQALGAALPGTGWIVPADSTMEALPQAVMTR